MEYLDYVNVYENDSSDEDEDFVHVVFEMVFPRRLKVIQERVDPFMKYREPEFIQRFRLSKNTVAFVIGLIKDEISSPTARNNAVTADEKVLLVLRYYATGSFIYTAGDFMGIHKSTAGKIIVQVSEALAKLRPTFISMPSTPDEMKSVRQDFFSIGKFPRCIGSTDCTHIRIASPGGDQAEIYRNRKGFFSLNIQTISDPQLQIRNIVARWPGSCHDSTILANSSIKQRFQNNEFGDSILIGDSGYAIQRYLITPLLQTAMETEEVFNESIIHTRNVVERSYGVWKRRFPILSRGIQVKISTAQAIIVACAVLHNIAREFGDQLPRVSDEVENQIRLTNFNHCLNAAVEGGNNSVHRRPFLMYFHGLLQ